MRRYLGKNRWILLTAFSLFFSGCATSQLANTSQPYEGQRIAVFAPHRAGYHFKDASSGDTDHMIFEDKSGTAFAQCYRLGLAYDKLDAEQTLDFVTKHAVDEHSQNFADWAKFDDQVADVTIGPATCKRIDFNGRQALEKAFPTVVAYDILCIHPEWAHSVYPYVVRIGANYLVGKNQRAELPVELKTFYQRVEFLPGKVSAD